MPQIAFLYLCANISYKEMPVLAFPHHFSGNAHVYFMNKIVTLSLSMLCCFGTSCRLEAQSLLPKPQNAIFRKGCFNTAKPFAVTNEAGFMAQNLYTAPLIEKNSADGKGRAVVFRKSDAAKGREAYKIRVTTDSLIIEAAAAEGFLRAGQTLGQLAATASKSSAAPSYPCCDIADAAAFEWRGMMLDVSRHFFPIEFLKKQIDVMARYKLNRLHLHLTDAAGWRMEIKRYPRLTGLGAWRTDASWKKWWNGDRGYVEEGQPGAHGGYYTQDQLRELVDYAAERGVTIVPEIEMPAHSEEALTAYPEYSCTHEPYKQADFCPGNAGVYDFLENVLLEVMDVFPSKDIHVGGDEAGKASWGNCPLCQRKMREEGLKDVNQLQASLIRHFEQFLESHGRHLIGWDEIIEDNLQKNTNVMVWRNVDESKKAIAAGNRVILSPGKFCYLDSYQDAPPTQPEAIGGYLPLEHVYAFNPLEYFNADELKSVRGVQGNLWTEYVPTPEHAEYMLYPRVLAIAEIGWNGTKKKDFADFRRRALNESELLRGKGVNAFDLKGEIGERPERYHTVKHNALGAKVTYNAPYGKPYPAAGETALTDGLQGGWTYGDGRWQGFIGKEGLDVTIDLGKTRTVSSVAATFMQVCGAEIYFPASFSVAVSADGKAFKEIYLSENTVEKTDKPGFRTEQFKGRGAKARYVRVKALPGAFGGWLFTDEIIVK